MVDTFSTEGSPKNRGSEREKRAEREEQLSVKTDRKVQKCAEKCPPFLPETPLSRQESEESDRIEQKVKKVDVSDRIEQKVKKPH